MNLTEAGALSTRTLTIVLPESEWQALRTAEPDAIGWLQAQIRRRLDTTVDSRQSSVASHGRQSESTVPVDLKRRLKTVTEDCDGRLMTADCRQVI